MNQGYPLVSQGSPVSTQVSGDPRYAEIVHRAARYLAQTDITRVFRRERDEHAGTSSLTLFGLWRLTVTQRTDDRAQDSVLRTARYDLEQRGWVDDDALHEWPSLQLLPVQRRPESLRFDWIELQHHAIREVHRQAVTHTPLTHHDRADLQQQLDAVLGLEALLGDPTDLEKPRDWGYGLERYDYSRRLWQRAWASIRPLKAFKKALWQHIDRATLALSARMVERYRPLSLWHYLRVATHRGAVRRIARERPNLLPLLPHLHERHWHRPDLFARALWVRGSRATTVVDRPTFYPPNTPPSRRFHSFDTRGVFQYLTRSPQSVVRRLVALWQEGSWRREDTERLIRLFQALTPQDTRAFARQLPLLGVFHQGHVSGFNFDMAHLQRDGQRDDRTAHGFPLEYERLMRAWIQAQLAVWRDAGYHALLRQLPQARHHLRSVLDWLASDGLPRGLPTKTQRWDVLLQRSQAWHEEMTAARHALWQRDNGVEVTEATARPWTAPQAHFATADFQAQALLTPDALEEEGQTMHHCVPVYAEDCADGHYLVYAITGAERATLGLIRTSRGLKVAFVIDQIQGPCNQPVSATVTAFAQHIAQTLTAAANTHNEHNEYNEYNKHPPGETA